MTACVIAATVARMTQTLGALTEDLESFDLAGLGALHEMLLKTLDQLRPALHERMREARAAGATYQELVRLSGYTSVNAVRQIVTPGVREQARQGERDRRAQRVRWG